MQVEPAGETAPEKETPEIDERGRRILFRLRHNDGKPVGGNRRSLKEQRKLAKASSKKFLRQHKRETGARFTPVKEKQP